MLSVLNPEFTFDFFERSLSQHFYPYTSTAAGGRLEVGKYLKRFNGFLNDFSEAVPKWLAVHWFVWHIFWHWHWKNSEIAHSGDNLLKLLGINVLIQENEYGWLLRKKSSKLLSRFTDLVYNLVDISAHASSFIPSHPPTFTITFAGYLGKHMRGRPLQRVSHIAALSTPSNHVPWYRRVHFPFQDLVQEVQDKVDCSIMIHHTIVLLLLEYTWRWAVSLRNIPFFLPPWCYATPMMLRSVGVWCNSTKNHAIWRISIRVVRILTPKPRP